MNIYEKLQSMRCELQGKKLSKSGKNSFVGYEYFELQDFIPEINEIMNKQKVTSVLTYGIKYARLKLINCEKPEEIIEFKSPMSEANLKGTHAVQNLGAVETYLRRYLYITAFEIVENDVLDGTQKEERSKTLEESQSEVPEDLGVCKDCGAPNKWSYAKKKRYCSELCWRNEKKPEEPKEEKTIEDDDLGINLDQIPF